MHMLTRFVPPPRLIKNRSCLAVVAGSSLRQRLAHELTTGSTSYLSPCAWVCVALNFADASYQQAELFVARGAVLCSRILS